MVNMNLNRLKIAFIMHVTNNEKYYRSLNSLKKLNIPKEYETEIIKVDSKNTNVAASYNQAMDSSNAKYKIYIREGIEIINNNFIIDIIRLFKKNWNIGIIGMSGVRVIPTDGNILSAVEHIGKIAINGQKELVFSECNNDYEKSAAIDEYLMVTQYDIKWRADLFSTESFYNIAQCIEFKKNNYNVIIAGQKKPWVLYAEKQIIATVEENKRFLD